MTRFVILKTVKDQVTEAKNVILNEATIQATEAKRVTLSKAKDPVTANSE